MTISAIGYHPIYNQSVNCKNRASSYSKPSFGNAPVFKEECGTFELTKEGKAVLDYVEKGCPKTEEGTLLYEQKFSRNPEFFNPIRNTLSVKYILDMCNGNLDVIHRALGKYGLELYGGLPRGYTIENKRVALLETEYYPKAGLDDNFINYIYWNRSGTIDEIVERFGENSASYIDSYVSAGVFNKYTNSYVQVNRPDSDDYLETEYNYMLERAMHKSLYSEV